LKIPVAVRDRDRNVRIAVPARVTVALNTGMRKGELVNLRWRDVVDFTSGTITIRDPKSGEDEHVLMNSTTQETLKTLWDLSTKVVQLQAGGPDRSSFVFTAPRGGFIQNLKRYWHPALRRAGIDDFHFTICVTRSPRARQ
jgi:integrase